MTGGAGVEDLVIPQDGEGDGPADAAFGPMPEGWDRVVSFWLRGQAFALPIGAVRETIALGRRVITRVFHVPDVVLGILNLRGTIMGVLDLGRCLGFPRAALSAQSRVLVAEGSAGKRTAGLLVDGVAPYRALDPGAMQPPPPTLPGERAARLRGVANQPDGRPVALVDLDAVLDAPELRALRRGARTQA